MTAEAIARLRGSVVLAQLLDDAETRGRAQGVADERARVVADLRTWCEQFGVTVQEQAVFMAAADRYERGEHEREGV